MAFRITTVAEAVSHTGVNILVHGPPGAGKTTLLSTVPDTSRLLILSAEGGLMSIKRVCPEAHQATITSIADLLAAYNYLRTPEAQELYDWIAIDSISEVAGLSLAEQLKKNKDGRKAYGEMGTQISKLVKAFRDLPYNVVMISAQGRVQDDSGALLYAAAQPGNSLNVGPKSVAYAMDEVWSMHVVQKADHTGKVSVSHMLQCGPDGRYECKSRSGVFELYEQPNLASMYARMIGDAPGE